MDKEIIGAFFKIENNNMLTDKIASFSNDANNYMMGGYLDDNSLFIIDFRKHIKNTFIAKFSFIITKKGL